MNISWSAIQPLIGGMAIAAEKVFKSPPSEVVSYSALLNEEHLINYYKDKKYTVPYTLVEENSQYKTNPYDVVVACPICSGLSMLNSSTGSERSRGSNAVQNENMYDIVDLALEKMRPKAFIIENAPTLATNLGKGVIQNLKQKSLNNKYSMTVIKTKTNLHGIPQNRPRTFVIFWNSFYSPLISFYNKECESLTEYLSHIPEDAHHQDEYYVPEDMVDNIYYLYMKHKFSEDFRDILLKSKCKSVAQYIERNDLFDDAIEFAHKIGREREAGTLSKFKRKVSLGKGYWDNSLHYEGEYSIPSVIGKSMGRLVHPTEDRLYNLREYMWFMGIPHDFNLVNPKGAIHLTQNVPVQTASDWMTEINKFLQEKLEFSKYNYIVHDNVRQRTFFGDLNKEELIEQKKENSFELW